jgi:hypothetical protein
MSEAQIQRYCPRCARSIDTTKKDTHYWYWLCPKCGSAVTMEERFRYCPACKEQVIAWATPTFNFVDHRPWWMRDPWWCVKCRVRSGGKHPGTPTYGGKAGAVIGKFFAVITFIIFMLVCLGCVVGFAKELLDKH